MDIKINDFIKANLSLLKKNEGATLLGIGPMSETMIRASLELANEKDFPLMFIASRNQVDSDEFGSGYVNGWNQERFVKDIKKIADEIEFKGLYYFCRDHGGPWQRDEERNAHLDEDVAMELGKKSYYEDIKNGFDLLMIDPTKDPFQIGKVIPLEVVLSRTVELIEYCEKTRKELGVGEISYEVGTEETNGGLTTTETYEKFITELNEELDKRNLPHPIFIVGQTGTLTRKAEQVGHFDYNNAKDLANMAFKYNVGVKEHNGDYMTYEDLIKHLPSHVTATNVAPEFGTVETGAIKKLADLEKFAYEKGLIDNTSDIEKVITTNAVKSRRWEKWVSDEFKSMETEEILNNEELSEEIFTLGGHYTFNDEEVKIEREKLIKNINSLGLDGERFIKEIIKESINRYAVGFNMIGITSKVRNELKK